MRRYKVGLAGKKILFFDGSSYVETPLDASGRSVFAVEVLFKMINYEAGTPQRPIAEYNTWLIAIPLNPTEKCWTGFYDADGTLRALAFPETPFEWLGRWIHVYVYFNVNEVVAYRNGEFIGRVTFPDSSIYTTVVRQLTRVGSDGAYFFNGFIALVRAYNRIHSSNEIRRLKNDAFNLRPASIRDGLILEFIPDTLDCENGVWRDNSGYGNHGTIYGARCVAV